MESMDLKSLLLEYADTVHMVAGIMKHSGVKTEDDIMLSCDEVKILKQSFAIAHDRIEKAYKKYLKGFTNESQDETDTWTKATKDVTTSLSGIEFYFLKVGQNNPMVCEMTLMKSGYQEDYKHLYDIVHDLETQAGSL